MPQNRFEHSSFRMKIGRKKDLPDYSFRLFYEDLQAWELAQLWVTFREWKKMRHLEELIEFDAELKRRREQIRARIDAWPTPLRNAKKGESYSCTFEMPEEIVNYVFHDLKKYNLDYKKDQHNPKICTIYGVPNQSGELELSFAYLWNGFREYLHVGGAEGNNISISRLALEKKLNLLVNPDPRDLWKDIPTDTNLEYFKPDTATSMLLCDGCQLLAASQRGRSHAHTGLPRDDDFAIDCVDGWQILAVADGAGSAKFSRQGSRIACDTVMEFIRAKLGVKNDLDDLCASLQPGAPLDGVQARKLAWWVLVQAAFEARKAIKLEAENRKREIREYATTLLLALAKKFPAGWVVMSFQIGDGAMGMFNENWHPTLLAEPDEGEFGGQTCFLTMDNIFKDNNELMRRLRIELVDNLQALVLMTDGVSDARFSTLANLKNSAYWRALWEDLKFAIADKAASPVDNLLNFLQFWSQGNHDDRTIAILKTPPLWNVEMLPPVTRPDMP